MCKDCILTGLLHSLPAANTSLRASARAPYNDQVALAAAATTSSTPACLYVSTCLSPQRAPLNQSVHGVKQLPTTSLLLPPRCRRHHCRCRVDKSAAISRDCDGEALSNCQSQPLCLSTILSATTTTSTTSCLLSTLIGLYCLPNYYSTFYYT